jgi:hypothetical protein
VRAAEHYLGMGDERVAMVITDYSPQGAPLRENRLDLWFVGRNQDAVSDWHQALSVPCIDWRTRGTIGARFQPTYQGRLPGHYTLRFPLYQWMPYVQRSMTFNVDSNRPRLHWEAVDATTIFKDASTTFRNNPHTARAVATEIGAQGWAVHVFGPNQFVSADPPDIHTGPPDVGETSLVEELSTIEALPWATTVSPSGRADLLDLLLDRGPDDWVVVAERQVGREIQIQRCVYRIKAHE